jgi:uncharacterized protein (TIGR03083 family)
MAELAGGDLTVKVPTCPDWTLRDLLVHTSEVHRWQTQAGLVDAGTFPDMSGAEKPPADDVAVAAWFQRGVDEAVAALSTVDPDAPRWTWTHPAGGDTAQWYFRRIAQETVVHRIDAELAAGDVTDVDPAMAADGVDELLDVFLPLYAGRPVGGNGETLHLHATDTDGEWLLTFQSDRIDSARGHSKGDAAVRAGARDLLLLAWGRAALGETETFGDEAVVARFRDLPRA